jgi:fructokinase
LFFILPFSYTFVKGVKKWMALLHTLGAGDAYATISAAGWLKKLPIDTIMGPASEFAGHICEIKGALPEDERIYHDFRQRIQKR